MKIQFCSDLHLEFGENRKFLETNPLKVTGDILVLAGDIVPFAIMSSHESFFSWAADHYKYTYRLPGNHEYYYSDITCRTGSVYEKIRSNVFLVNNQVIVHESTRLLFSTLWSFISPVNYQHFQQSFSDFRVIRSGKELFNPDQFTQLHQDAVQFITGSLKDPHPGNTVVVTHHVPTLYHYPEKYKGSELNEAFVTELHDLVYDSGVDYWIYGHHHQNIPEFKIGRSRLVTNQLGYVRYGEQEGFSGGRGLIID